MAIHESTFPSYMIYFIFVLFAIKTSVSVVYKHQQNLKSAAPLYRSFPPKIPFCEYEFENFTHISNVTNANS